jgi:hypothetical protein
LNRKSLWKYAPPFGPIFNIALIGLLLLSALLYYRSVKIQRFLEPALAITQPKYEFSKKIKEIFENEFGTEPIKGIELKASSIFITKSLFFSKDGTIKSSAQPNVKKLARFFLSLLDDSNTKSDISTILFNSHFHSGGPKAKNDMEGIKDQYKLWLLLNTLLHSEPDLGKKYINYFNASAQPVSIEEGDTEALELRIITSDHLHVEVLQKLFKYAH